MENAFHLNIYCFFTLKKVNKTLIWVYGALSNNQTFLKQANSQNPLVDSKLDDPLMLFCRFCCQNPAQNLLRNHVLWWYFFLFSDPCFLLHLFSLPLLPLVLTGNKAVPAPPGALVSHQHLSGGWHPHVVPVERAERLHWGNLELRLLPGNVFCAA